MEGELVKILNKIPITDYVFIPVWSQALVLYLGFGLDFTIYSFHLMAGLAIYVSHARCNRKKIDTKVVQIVIDEW